MMHSQMLSGEIPRAGGPLNMCEREYKTTPFAFARTSSALVESVMSFVPPSISQLTGFRALSLSVFRRCASAIVEQL